ncbi:MAG: DegT/DnrJ/EryC1/StrS family aminotransferase [Colwellia sp.]|jgi:Predicted pyridoxal phosphate-dependent enzyme apparently involved in regulation of cell wall biogenesis
MNKVVNESSIPVYKPTLSGNEKKYVNECLDSTWISSKGDFIPRFEREFSNYLNVQAATTVSNGTVALHLALLALGIGPGDEVIVPTFTYVASVNAISYVGATPVFVDSLADTWNLDPEQVAAKVTSHTKAVMIVHLYGNPCAMDQLEKICNDNGLYLIEDAAEAFGSIYKGKYVGSFGDVATFSFFGNKTITTGEGGMLTSNNEILIKRAVHLKNQSVSSSKEYWHDEVGFNFRMTNICAAIGVAQIENADNVLTKKQKIASWYCDGLRGLEVEFQFTEKDSVNSYWMVSILAKNSVIRGEIRRYLKEHSIETRPLFYPAHTLPAFIQGEVFPVAESLSERGINLPSYPDLSEKSVLQICDLIKCCLSELTSKVQAV